MYISLVLTFLIYTLADESSSVKTNLLLNTNIESQVEDIVNFEQALSLKVRKYKESIVQYPK